MEGQAASSVVGGQHQPLGLLRLVGVGCVTIAVPETQERPLELGQLARCRRVDDRLQEVWDVVGGRHGPVYRPNRHRLPVTWLNEPVPPQMREQQEEHRPHPERISARAPAGRIDHAAAGT